MRVLVCGGRDYADSERVYTTLSAIHVRTPITVIIQGGAGRKGAYLRESTGADLLAKEWAEGNHVGTLTYKADWLRQGRAAGPIRNAYMLAKSKPDLVVAFPGGRGTADMVAKAKAAGVTVMEIVE